MSDPGQRQDLEDEEILCWKCHRYFPKATMTVLPMPLTPRQIRVDGIPDKAQLERIGNGYRSRWFCATCYASLNRRSNVLVVIVLVVAATFIVAEAVVRFK